MSNLAGTRESSATVIRGLEQILSYLPQLQQLALDYREPGTMHGLDLLLGSRFARRKSPCLICFHAAENTEDSKSAAKQLIGAVLLHEYCLLGLRTGVFATGDAFGVRTVVGAERTQGTLCLRAGHLLLASGARLVLTTWRGAMEVSVTADPAYGTILYASTERTVQDTLRLAPTAEATLQLLGKRTRVHMRAARRHFDQRYPQAQLQDATAVLAAADDATLAQLNRSALDTIDQGEFNHQVRALCRSAGGFALGLRLDGRWVALIGGWRQAGATWIEWQCNGTGYEKLSVGTVLRTYLLEEEARRGSTHLSFHGGTSHSMLHRFDHTTVTDQLLRRNGLLTDLLIRTVPWLGSRFPTLLQRGNFIFNALCAQGLRWSTHPTATPTR
ncbi:MAG: GNAT family N-acetyltransferase [Janthinobacterium lividum]